MNIGNISHTNYTIPKVRQSTPSRVLSKEERTYLKELFPEPIKKQPARTGKSSLYDTRTKISLGRTIDIKV